MNHFVENEADAFRQMSQVGSFAPNQEKQCNLIGISQCQGPIRRNCRWFVSIKRFVIRRHFTVLRDRVDRTNRRPV